MKVVFAGILLVILVPIGLGAVAQDAAEATGVRLTGSVSVEGRTPGDGCETINVSVSESTIRCEVAEGESVAIQLDALVGYFLDSPAGSWPLSRIVNNPVAIVAENIPDGLPSFEPQAGYGTATATYSLTVPASSGGDTLTLTFAAVSSSGATGTEVPLYAVMRVVLVVRLGGVPAPSWDGELIRIPEPGQDDGTDGEEEELPAPGCIHALWTHGSSIQLENPEATTGFRRYGFWSHVDGKGSSSGWFHFAIPTCVVGTCYNASVGQEIQFRYRLWRVLLMLKTSGPETQVTSVHIWDGAKCLARRDNLRLSGDPGMRAFYPEGTPLIVYGVGISIRVQFPPAGGWVEFIAAGGDFLLGSQCSCE